MDDFASAVGPETMIFPVLNGMRHVDLLAKRFGEHAVIGGVCLVAVEIDARGRVVQLADVQQLVYGERNGQSTPRLKTLDATLHGAGFDARLSTDIMQEMWEKWIQLASLGAVTCLMRANDRRDRGCPRWDRAVDRGAERVRCSCHCLRPQAIGRFPFTKRRRNDKARIFVDVFDVSRFAKRRAGRGRSYPGRLYRTRQRTRSFHAILESGFRQSPRLSGQAAEALRRADYFRTSISGGTMGVR